MPQEIIDPETGEARMEYSAEEKSKLLSDWLRAVDVVKKTATPAIEAERDLRRQVAQAFFASPKEGTNNLEVFPGWKLKYVYKLDRKIDEAALPAAYNAVRELGYNPDTLVKPVPALQLTAYKSFAEAHPEAATVFNVCLIVKPGSPTLELIPPKNQTIDPQGQENLA